MRLRGRRLIPFAISAGLVGSIGLAMFAPMHNASAQQITNRSLTLQAGTGTGGSQAGAYVNHLFTFTIPTSGNLGSILFQYCTTSAGTCTMPAGLDTTTATLGSQNGATFTSLVTNTGGATNGSPYLTRSAAPFNSGAVTFQLLNVKNPTAVNTSFYVRISTYASTDATGSPTDTGTVTASTATQIVLSGIMPETIIFCTGATISTNAGGIPDCSTATPGNISFNQLFSPTDTATATSQMAASTNAGNGYVIQVNGPTLTSGTNTIAALGSPTQSTHGKSQFGLNLRANTTPAVGTDVTPAADGTGYKGEATAPYSSVNNYQFISGTNVADSNNGGAGPSDSQIFTASYIVNVKGSQPAGTYTTTLTYICTATF